MISNSTCIKPDISLHARSQPYIRRPLGNGDPDNTFLKCYCHTTTVGLGNFPVHLGSQTAKSILKEGNLQSGSSSNILDCFLPSTVNLCHFVRLCIFDLAFTECNLSWFLTPLQCTVKKIIYRYFALYHKQKITNSIFIFFFSQENYQ